MNENNEITFNDLFKSMGYDPQLMEINKSIDVSQHGYETKSLKDNKPVWSLIKSIIKKESTDTYHVSQFNLNVSPLHLFYVKVDGSEPHWVEATALTDCNNVQAYHESVGWTPIDVVWHQNQKTDILDIEVEDTHSYFSNGILSHNTMHGDPDVTPGGKSIPYHASIRIKLSSGTQVKDKAGNVIGIHVIATIKKNKVAPPFRKCEFDIIFGKGITEDEYIFDQVRAYCKETGVIKRKGKTINVSGDAAWKELSVVDDKTGEVVIEKKFYKSEFGELLRDKQHGPWLMEAVDCALTLVTGSAATSSELEEDNATDDGGLDA